VVLRRDRTDSARAPRTSLPGLGVVGPGRTVREDPTTRKGSIMTKRKHPKPAAKNVELSMPALTRARAPTKLVSLQNMVERPGGATIAEMMEVTGWQAHSVRGAISGALRKTRGIEVVSELHDGERRYRVGSAA